MFNIKTEGPLYVVYDDATGVTIKECQTAREAAIYVSTEKAGDVGNLAKHLSTKYGTDHLFTDCMGDETTSDYEHDTRAAVCARVHHEATGKWPTEKEMKEAKMSKTQAAVKADYPWDQCIADQMKRYGDKDRAEKVCGAIRAKYGGKEIAEKEYAEIEAELGIEPKEAKSSILDQVVALFSNKEGRRHSSTDQDAIQQIHDLSTRAGADCSMMVTKQADGKYRWILLSSNAYEDRDGEWVSLKAQKRDTERMTEEKDYGPLRLWHLGYPNTETKEAGPGVDIGDCDLSMMIGKVRIESGTFRNERIAAAIKERADQWGTSVGFFHPPDEPVSGVYRHIHTFERSLLPLHKASNPLTPIAAIVKENSMTTKEDKVRQLTELLGKDLADDVLEAADKTEKQAVQQGLKYKQAAPVAVKAADGPKGGDGKDDDEPDEDDLSDMDEATQKAYNAMMPHIVKAIHNLTKKSNIEGKKERKAAKKERKAQAKMKEQVDTIAQAVAALQGELPRGLAGGYRASQSDFTILPANAFKEAQAQPDPLGEFMTALGMATTPGNGKQG